MLSTELVGLLRKAAIDQEIWFSTEQYGCLQNNNMILTPLERPKHKFSNLKMLSIFERDNMLFVCSLNENCDAEKHYKIMVPSKKTDFHRISV